VTTTFLEHLASNVSDDRTVDVLRLFGINFVRPLGVSPSVVCKLRVVDSVEEIVSGLKLSPNSSLRFLLLRHDLLQVGVRPRVVLFVIRLNRFAVTNLSMLLKLAFSLEHVHKIVAAVEESVLFQVECFAFAPEVVPGKSGLRHGVSLVEKTLDVLVGVAPHNEI